MCHSKSTTAGRDVITRENKTHIEEQTRHVYSKISGFHILELNASGAGGGGFTGIGLVGEIFILISIGLFALWCLKKCLAHRVRHNSYKAFYRAQVADSPYSLPVPAIGNPLPDYGPNNRRIADLDALANDVKELKRARRDFERRLVPAIAAAPVAPAIAAAPAAPTTAATPQAAPTPAPTTVTTTAEVHGNPDGVGRHVRNVYVDGHRS